ncbi:MAG TPA: cytochrome c [Mucilaginibacter sp.]|nr:cytochrome c [Mucilaginibacter sp.]
MKIKLIGAICILVIVTIISCQDNGQIEYNRYFSSGNAVYQEHCQNCHGVKGEGLQGLIPPLTDSVFMKKNGQRLACFLNSGLKEKITVGGKEFEGEMPASGLSPVEIAEVLTYVTNSFGNNQGTVTVEKVNADLAKCN